MSVPLFPWPRRPLCQRASVAVILAFCFGSVMPCSPHLVRSSICTKVIRGRSESKEMTSWTARLWAKTSFGYAETADKVRGENCRAGMNLGGYRYASFLVHNLMSHSQISSRRCITMREFVAGEYFYIIPRLKTLCSSYRISCDWLGEYPLRFED